VKVMEGAISREIGMLLFAVWTVSCAGNRPLQNRPEAPAIANVPNETATRVDRLRVVFHGLEEQFEALTSVVTQRAIDPELRELAGQMNQRHNARTQALAAWKKLPPPSGDERDLPCSANDFTALENSGGNFDQTALTQMIAYRQCVVAFLGRELQGAGDSTLKEILTVAVKEFDEEIRSMTAWKGQWAGTK